MEMPFPVQTSLRLAPPVSAGGRLLVPLVRISCVPLGTGGMAQCAPVALLVRERETWSFVPLEEGIDQGILTGLDLPTAPGPGLPEPGAGGGGNDFELFRPLKKIYLKPGSI